MMTVGEKLGKCLNVLRLMHQKRLATDRPKAHAWHHVNVELVLSVGVEGRMGLEILTTEVNRRTGKMVRDDIVYKAEGDNAERLMQDALTTLEGAIMVYMRESGPRVPQGVSGPFSADGVKSLVFASGEKNIRVEAPEGCWFSMNLFAMGRGAWPRDN